MGAAHLIAHSVVRLVGVAFYLGCSGGVVVYIIVNDGRSVMVVQGILIGRILFIKCLHYINNFISIILRIYI